MNRDTRLMENNIMKLPLIGVFKENCKDAIWIESLNGNRISYMELQSLFSNMACKNLENKDAIIEYINKGIKLVSIDVEQYDCFTGEVIGDECAILTDGEHRWLSNLGHYVKEYNIKLPTEFVAKAMCTRREIETKDEALCVG